MDFASARTKALLYSTLFYPSPVPRTVVTALLLFHRRERPSISPSVVLTSEGGSYHLACTVVCVILEAEWIAGPIIEGTEVIARRIEVCMNTPHCCT